MRLGLESTLSELLLHGPHTRIFLEDENKLRNEKYIDTLQITNLCVLANIRVTGLREDTPCCTCVNRPIREIGRERRGALGDRIDFSKFFGKFKASSESAGAAVAAICTSRVSVKTRTTVLIRFSSSDQTPKSSFPLSTEHALAPILFERL